MAGQQAADQADGTGPAWLQDRAGQIDARRARRENFPVASRLLATTTRHDLLAVYTLARLIDDAGDEAPGNRLALLDFLDDDLRRLAGGPATPTLGPVRALLPAVRERGLPVGPFHDLVSANRMDQQVSRYADLDALRGYCRLSAEPVGRLVLAVWGLADARRTALSDDICTGLQIAEHLQDVGEDLNAGRIYLPRDAMAAHGVTEPLLAVLADSPGGAPAADRARVAALLADLAGQARGLLLAGTPLVGLVPGPARVAVAGFVAGGLAALDAVLGAADTAVRTTPRPRKRRVLLHTTSILVTRRTG